MYNNVRKNDKKKCGGVGQFSAVLRGRLNQIMSGQSNFKSRKIAAAEQTLFFFQCQEKGEHAIIRL